MFVLEYSLTKEDYYNFSYYTGWQAPDKKKLRVFYHLSSFLYITVGCLLVDTLLHKQFSLLHTLKLCGFVALAVFAYVPFLIKWRYKRTVEKILANPQNASILAQSQLTISDSGINSKEATSEVKYEWNAIVKKIENKECYYLFINTQQAVIIPRSVLNENDEQKLKQYMSRNLPLTAEFSFN